MDGASVLPVNLFNIQALHLYKEVQLINFLNVNAMDFRLINKQ